MLRGGEVVAEISGDPAVTHGQRLPDDLRRALDTAGAAVEDVDLLAVIAGPGSFTGLRVGIATVQGLAFARGLRIVPVSSLDALARQAAVAADGRAIASWVDAQRGEVYAALFSPALDLRAGPSSRTPAEVLREWRLLLDQSRTVFTGDGASRYRDVILRELGDGAVVLDPPPLLAATAGRIAAGNPDRAVLPHAVAPIYVRRPDAELARERRQQEDRGGTGALTGKAGE